MKKIYINILVTLMLIGGVTIIVNINSSNATSDYSKNFKAEYEALNYLYNSNKKSVRMNIPLDNPIVYSNLTEILDVIKTKTGIVYFGFPECPWCRNAVPVLLDSAKNNNIEKIYYLNPKDYRNLDNRDYQELVSILNPYLKEDENGIKKLYVPDVYFIKDGKVVGNHLGTIDSQDDPYVALTDNQRKELYNIYSDLLNKIK